MKFGWEIKDMFFDRAAVQRAVDAGVIKPLGRVAGFIRKTAQRSMRRVPKPREGSKRAAKVVPPSQPGTPPRSRIGRLRDLLFYGFDPGGKTVVAGPVKLGRGEAPPLEEFGGTATRRRIVKRPALRETTEAQRAAYAEGVRSGRIPAPERQYVEYQATYPERPYMGPALDKHVDQLPDEFTGSISG